MFLHHDKKFLSAIKDGRTMLVEVIAAPTLCRELVSNWPLSVGVKDASSHGVGVLIFGLLPRLLSQLSMRHIYVCVHVHVHVHELA